MERRISVAAFILPLLGVAQSVAQTVEPKDSRNEQAQHEAYVQLNNQIYSYENPDSQHLHLVENDQVADIVTRLENLVRRRIGSVLRSSNSSAEAITEAIRGLQGEDLALHPNPGETNTPFAEYSKVNGERTLLVAYTILRGGEGIPDSLPVLDFYVQTSSEWELKDTAPTDLTASTLFIRRMDSPLAGELWYLVWGNRLGDTGTRLRIRLYAFNGAKVRTVWKSSDLTHGVMQEVAAKSITFNYEKVYNSGQRTYENLYITPNGLE